MMAFKYNVSLDEHVTAGFNDIGDLLRYVQNIIEDEDGIIGKVTIEVEE